jgi:hypothetical protein
MTAEEIIAKVKKRARNNFKTGMNCAECVLEAVLSTIDTGMSPQTMCLMTGFGSGGRPLRGHLRLPGGGHGGPGGGLRPPAGAH